MVGLTKI